MAETDYGYAPLEQDLPLGISVRLRPEDRIWWDAELRTLFDAEGGRLAARVRRGIRDQVWDHAELSAAYAAWKDEQGLDPRILVATGEYVSAIIHRPTAFGFEIGVMAGTHLQAQVAYETLGLWLEYGTFDAQGNVKMPARPHFRPAIAAWRAEAEDAFLARVGRHVAHRLSRRLREMGARRRAGWR